MHNINEKEVGEKLRNAHAAGGEVRTVLTIGARINLL